jgi:hypothetical protein
MTLTLLLVLAGLLEADSHTRTKPSDGLDAQPAVAAQRGRAEKPDVPPRSPKRTDPGLRQLQNKRTGVTCTLRILRIDPPVDIDMVVASAGTSRDRVTHNELSPCVE